MLWTVNRTGFWIPGPEVLQHARRVDSHIVSMFLLAGT